MLSSTMRSRASVSRIFRQIPNVLQAARESQTSLSSHTQPQVQTPAPSFTQKQNFSHFWNHSDSSIHNKSLSHHVRPLHQNTTHEEEKEVREILSDESGPSQGIDAYDRAVSADSKESDEREEIEETHTYVKIVSSTLIPDNVPQDDPTDGADYEPSGQGVVRERRERTVTDVGESERAGRRRPWERRRREKTEVPIPSRENIAAVLADLVSSKSCTEEPVSLLEHLCNRFPRELVVNFNVIALRPKYVVDATLEIISPTEPKVTVEAGRGEAHSKKIAKHSAAIALVEKLAPNKEGDSLEDEHADDSMEEEEDEEEEEEEEEEVTNDPRDRI